MAEVGQRRATHRLAVAEPSRAAAKAAAQRQRQPPPRSPPHRRPRGLFCDDRPCLCSETVARGDVCSSIGDASRGARATR